MQVLAPFATEISPPVRIGKIQRAGDGMKGLWLAKTGCLIVLGISTVFIGLKTCSQSRFNCGEGIDVQYYAHHIVDDGTES